MAATFHSAVMPPTWLMSVWRMSTTPISISSRHPYDAIRRSPVAIGVVERRAIRAMALTFSGGHGSSMNSRFSGSTSLTRTDATLGLVLAWKSMAMSMSGPRPFAQESACDLTARSIFGVRLDPLVIAGDARS